MSEYLIFKLPQNLQNQSKIKVDGAQFGAQAITNLVSNTSRSKYRLERINKGCFFFFNSLNLSFTRKILFKL
jgi:hypothetical protein